MTPALTSSAKIGIQTKSAPTTAKRMTPATKPMISISIAL